MTIIPCPECRENVTIPDGIGRRAHVRCPWCQEEYLLSTALGHLPPPLIVVYEPDDSMAAEAPVARFHAAGVSVAVGAARGESDIAGLDRNGSETHSEPTSPSYRFKEPPVTMVRTASPVSTVVRPRTRRKQVNPIRAVAQVVGGGLVGLVIAQLILWWMPGDWPRENRDPLQLAQSTPVVLEFLVPPSLRAARPMPIPDQSGAPSSLEQPARLDGEREPPSTAVDAIPEVEASIASEPKTSDSIRDSGEKVPAAAIPSSITRSEKNISPAGNFVDSSKSEPPILNTVDSSPLKSIPAVPPDEISQPAAISSSRPKQTPIDTTRAVDPVRKYSVRNARAVDADEARRRLKSLETANLAYDAAFTNAPNDLKMKLIVELYDALALLGEVTVSLECDPARREAILAELRNAVETVASQPDKRTWVGRYATVWLRPNRLHQGVVLLGKPVKQQPAGDVMEVRVKLLTKDEQEVAVVVDSLTASAYSGATTVLVLGTIVDNASDNLAGYQGTSPQVIIGGLLTSVPSE